MPKSCKWPPFLNSFYWNPIYIFLSFIIRATHAVHLVPLNSITLYKPKNISLNNISSECVNRNATYVCLLISEMKLFDGRTDKWTVVLRQQWDKCASVYLSLSLNFTSQIEDEAQQHSCSASETKPCDNSPQLGVNRLKTKHRLLYLKTQFVPRCKHFSSRLKKPISLCCKWHKSLFVLR